MLFLGVVLFVSFVGWVMIVIAAFRANVWWGLSMLLGPFVIYALFRNNIWANILVGLALTVAFVSQHWDTARTGFIIYIVGYALSIPGQLKMVKQIEDIQAGQQVAQKVESRPETRAPRPYTPPPAAIVPPAPAPVDRTPRAPSQERPDVYMATPVARVYVHNVTKKYYPLDCATRPEGAYPIARSLAIGQGFKLAAECAK